jgi:hypothetical protein
MNTFRKDAIKYGNAAGTPPGGEWPGGLGKTDYGPDYTSAVPDGEIAIVTARRKKHKAAETAAVRTAGVPPALYHRSFCRESPP